MSSEIFFPYGEEEIEYLKSRDRILAPLIDEIGPIQRPMDEGLFESVIHHIIGQQISTAAQRTVFRRMKEGLGELTPHTIADTEAATLQSFGITMRKADYLHDFAAKVASGAFDLDAIVHLPDDEAITALSSLKGIGTWTAEMILLFSLGRPNIFAFDDLAIQRGLRMVYHHRKITRPLFEKYRRRFSPYGSVASLYFWEISHGVIPYLVDHAPKAK